ncbi:ABC transporter ATP-binding protein [Mycolicibacterium litorale]|uniref:Trehalose import ATP-binding protein SugC n=1 Tax=Mycolicibacterium litorale TaxID=758802 RepID=A0AAD1INE3_9MYCO|nr:ABC transporter ATP-binding protein [Mycolicibacterium litorale]MCV7416478.1 ABC transporter ATP-binding protein [Mycolicibacterium litorale]TDY09732.1 carbohydrate ABC transporter ATP-binding protein (CUT1 family) [Mycolicibacterium litorale]BBY17678.1 sugar ABC transporter ATP-binding protein [Mycolicibacterium litorale]
MSTIELAGLTKTYGTTTVVDDVTLTLPDGSLTVLVGPSGCGKSTTLRIVAGLEPADGGAVHIGERDVTRATPRERDVAMVFQNYALYPHLSVAGNIGFPLRNNGVARDEVARRVGEAAERVGITALLDRKPRQLSGGQQQRVAIARALVRTPSVFLFDEPLSNLDAKLRVELRSEIRRLQQDTGITALYVTHDQEEAMTIADQLVVLNAGRIAQKGTPEELYRRPANTFVAGFIGSPSMNLVPGRLESGVFTGDGVTFAVAGSGAVTLGVRPEDLLVTPSASGLGRVDLVELLGPRYVLIIRAGAHRLTAVVEAATVASWPAVPAPGDGVDVTVRPERVHLFDAASGERV